MKKLGTLFLLLVLCVSLFAQAPQAFKYQAIARDEAGNILTNQNIGVRISVVSENNLEDPEFVETHLVKSSPFGLINLSIRKRDKC